MGEFFAWRGGVLHAEGVSLEAIDVPTPFYCYAGGGMVAALKDWQEALGGLRSPAKVCFAVKANGNTGVLALLARHGAGMDVVSGGEILRAQNAGVSPAKMVFSGVGKTDDELAQAVQLGVGQFNVESEAEVHRLSGIAGGMNKQAKVALRVNPSIGAGGHAKITTGHAASKFGIPVGEVLALYRALGTMEGITPVGLAVHIGSLIRELAPLRASFAVVAELARTLLGEGLSVHTLDMGGGLAPDASLAAYVASIGEAVGDLPVEVVVEPGRALVARAGVLLTRVVVVKKMRGRTFLIVDAAMNDFPRPAMYGARHPVFAVREGKASGVYDIAGPVCESGDVLARREHLPPVKAGDLLAFGEAGAYCAVMASEYNARPLVPEVLVEGDAWHVVRQRPTVAYALGLESLPPWLGQG